MSWKEILDRLIDPKVIAAVVIAIIGAVFGVEAVEAYLYAPSAVEVVE